jgi:hypothetical protein
MRRLRPMGSFGKRYLPGVQPGSGRVLQSNFEVRNSVNQCRTRTTWRRVIVDSIHGAPGRIWTGGFRVRARRSIHLSYGGTVLRDSSNGK